MKDGAQSYRTALATEVLDRVDRICDRFEAAWKAGDRPRIEDYLGELDDVYRPALLADLLAAELHARRRRGEHPPPGEYADRFPAAGPAIDAAFTRVPTAGPADVPTALAGRSMLDRPEQPADAVPNATPAHLSPDCPTTHHGGADDPAGFAAGPATADGQRFRALRLHASGGLGAVFVAMDTELNREVALKKILEEHADDPATRSRFMVEAEVTGGLEHPGIVPVYGLGTDAGGRPYYAMRLIRGDSLKEAIDTFHADEAPRLDAGRRSLELRQLLRRFTDICNAIEYAHSRGVLHRDLKPGNVIVGRHGETLVVDWGLAKPTGRIEPGPGAGERPLSPTSAGGTAETLPGSVLGTPAYMSPEQAAGELDRLGYRSDIYSLGAILYCLLTGRPPFEGEDAWAVLQAVRLGAGRPPRAVDPSLDRALEAVCVKAMARQPEGRYDSARALAEDVERWLADEPVSAWREPASRRLRRWARRHRTAVTAAAVAALAGLIGLGAVAAIQARSNAALRMANAATRDALDDTRREKARTEEALAQSEAVRTFLVEAFRSPDPHLDGRDIKVADVLGRASKRLDEELRGSEATRGALLDALGRTYEGLGLPAEAVQHMERAAAVREAALGPDHPDTLKTRIRIVFLHAEGTGRAAEAVALGEALRRSAESKLGADHPNTLECRAHLAVAYRTAGRMAEAIALGESTLGLYEAKFGPDHPDTLDCRNNLAVAYDTAGRVAEAIAMHEKTLRLTEAKFGPDHPDTLTSLNNLALSYWGVGRAADAVPLHERALRVRESRLGPDHPDTLVSRNNLGIAYLDAGRHAEAVVLNEETVKLYERKLGPDHPSTLTGRGNLAQAYLLAGRTREAIALHESTLELSEAKLGSDHPDTLVYRINLARAYQTAGRAAEAIPLEQRTLELCRAKLGPDHPYTILTLRGLAAGYEAIGRWADAEALQRDALARRRKSDGPDSLLLASDLDGLGRNLLRQRKWPEAELLLRECLTIREKAGPDDWHRFHTMSLLGGALLGRGDHAKAEPFIVRACEELSARRAKIPAYGLVTLRDAAERVVRLYEDWGKPGESDAWKRKLGLVDLPADVFARP